VYTRAAYVRLKFERFLKFRVSTEKMLQKALLFPLNDRNLELRVVAAKILTMRGIENMLHLLVI
jgi:hypothetical protein